MHHWSKNPKPFAYNGLLAGSHEVRKVIEGVFTRATLLMSLSAPSAWLLAVLLLATTSTCPLPSLVAAEPDPRETGRPYLLHECKPGPWGKLSYFYFYLEAPDHVVAQFPMPSPVTRWTFDGRLFDTLRSRLSTAGVPSGTLDRLFSERRMVKDARHVYLFPTRSDLESLTPAVRSAVYAELASLPANEFHHSPIFFLSDTVEEWAQDSQLPARIVEKIKLMSYKVGEALVFSDIPYLVSIAESDAEARMLLRKMTRVRTLMARLEISKTESVAPLLEYWSTGLGLRRKELEPLINAISQTEGVSHLDLLHLLPPLPRKLLYTYPDASHAAMGRLPDCHWTCLNFFNFQPQNYFLDTRLATSAVLGSFDRVSTPYRYGDILMFVNRDGQAVHSATYIADDLAYTKNGMTMMAPWVVMRLGDLRKLYGVSAEGTRIEGFRHKTPSL